MEVMQLGPCNFVTIQDEILSMFHNPLQDQDLMFLGNEKNSGPFLVNSFIKQLIMPTNSRSCQLRIDYLIEDE